MTLGRGSSASGQLARLGFTEPALAAAALESGALGLLLDHEQVLLDLAATARASFSVYSTRDDIDALAAGLIEVERVFNG